MKLYSVLTVGLLLTALSGCADTSPASVEGQSVRAAAPATDSEGASAEPECGDERYADFKAHLESRGATPSCDAFYEYLEGGPPVVEDREAADVALQEQYVEVPDLVGLDPNTAYDVAQEWGLTLSNGRVGSWGVVATQTPRAGSEVEIGSSIFISVNSGGGGGGYEGGFAPNGGQLNNGNMNDGGSTYENGGGATFGGSDSFGD